MENLSGDWTRLLYCTTGVLLRKLQHDRHLSSLTHIIVDEVLKAVHQTVNLAIKQGECFPAVYCIYIDSRYKMLGKAAPPIFTQLNVKSKFF